MNSRILLPTSRQPSSNTQNGHPMELGVGHPSEKEVRCGWRQFQPKCLQESLSAKWVLFWLCWAGAVQGMVVNGFVNVCITTIEKRYHLKSADTGLIAGAYDMASLVFSIPVSYLGSLPGASKPRWVGLGIILMGFGSWVFAIPYFASPLYKDVESLVEQGTDVMFCAAQANLNSGCDKQPGQRISSFRFLFALGQFLHGIGAAPLYTLGITFLDESVPVRSSSLYLGVFYAMAIVGPAFGYVAGGQFLNIYIDSPTVNGEQLGLQPSSDMWLGAWWIGFLLSGCLSFIIGLAIMAFPREIPGYKTRQLQRMRESNVSAVSVSSPHNSFKDIKDLPKASKVLLSNKTFVCLSLAGASEGILLTGFATFIPKFIEGQFSISASHAAVIVGIVAVLAGGGGTLLGGWIIKRFMMKCADVLKLCCGLSIVCFFAYFSFVISCPDMSFAGVTKEYMNSSFPLKPNLSSACNRGCNCDEVPFNPVCGTDLVLYFSPCHAGCQSVTLINGSKVFSDCKCVGDSLKYDQSTWPNGFESHSALLQKCPSDCSLLSVFLLVFSVIMFITFVVSLPAVSGTLRCVPDSYRSLALGIQWIIVRIMGTITGPILFGLIIDSTCRLWQDTCKVTGACRSYDNRKMSRSMMATSLIVKCFSTIFFCLSWWFYGPRRPTEQENEARGDNSISTVSSSTATARVNLGYNLS